MTTQLTEKLAALRSRGERGLIPYITAGDPDVETTRDILVAMTEAGAAALEVGIPFSDPIADGPTIQASSQRAIDTGASLSSILDMLEANKERLAPTIIFSYLNPIDRIGYRTFAERARAAGVSALLVTDATPGTEPELEDALREAGLDLICLVAPTTPESRLPLIAERASGFIYLVARRGVTGVGSEQDEATTQVERLQKLTDVPLYVGFGVRTREDVQRISAYADGVIVGSALVELLHNTPREARAERAGAYIRELLGN